MIRSKGRGPTHLPPFPVPCVNTATIAAYPDVDSARIQWDSPTEGVGSWDDLSILSLCQQIKRQVNSPRSSNLKLYNIAELAQQIEDTIKAKGR